MNQSNRGSIDAQIKQAELKRVKAETAKAKAEEKKVALESAELERPWYKKLRSLQTFAAIVVSIPVIWFYVTEIALPFNKAENIRLALRNEIIGDSLNNQIKALKKEKEFEADRYKLRLDELQLTYAAADSALKDLIRAHRDLSGRYEITQKQRDEIAREQQALLARLEKQRKDLDRLSVQRIVTGSTQIVKDRATSSAKTPEIIIDSFVPDARIREISHMLMMEIRDSQYEMNRFLFVQTRIEDLEVTTPFRDGMVDYRMLARSDTTDLRWYQIRKTASTVIFRTATGLEKILELSSSDSKRIHYLRVSEKQ